MIRKKYHKIMLLFYQASWFFKGELRKKKNQFTLTSSKNLEFVLLGYKTKIWCGTFPLFDGSKLITFHMH